MSLERYAENSWIRPEATSREEIADQQSIVDRCLKDAAVEGISDDLRFYTTYNAILSLATIALRACGYRVASQQGHHQKTLETVEFTLNVDDRFVRRLLSFSKKRNAASYDAAGSVSNEEVKQIGEAAIQLREKVAAFLQANHSSLL